MLKFLRKVVKFRRYLHFSRLKDIIKSHEKQKSERENRDWSFIEVYEWPVVRTEGKKVRFKSQTNLHILLHVVSPYWLLDPCCAFYFSLLILCKKRRKCSKPRHHVGKCDSKKQFNRFWEESAFYKLKISQADVSNTAIKWCRHNSQGKLRYVRRHEEDIMVKRQEIAIKMWPLPLRK